MLPKVILHTAVSVDGRIDWLAVDVGLYYELAARWPVEAMLTGADTLLAAPNEVPPEEALPEPPRPEPGDPRPLLAVTDSRGRLRNWRYWRSLPYWRDAVALVSRSTPTEYLDHLRSQGVEHVVAGGERVDLGVALTELATRYGVKSVRVDSGGSLNGALLRAGLATEVSVLIHPSLVGGTSPRSLYRAPDLVSADGVIPLRLMRFERLRGDAIWLVYEVAR